MQKAGEPENDAGFPKHNYSAVVIHTPLSLYNCERSELSSLFNARIFYIYIYIYLYIYMFIYIFQAVRRAVNVLNVCTYI